MRRDPPRGPAAIAGMRRDTPRGLAAIAGIRCDMPRRLAAAVVLAAVGVIAIALGGCGSDGSASRTRLLDTSKVSRAIEQSIQRERHLHAQVSCPLAVPQTNREAFVCMARTAGATTPFAVTESSSSGEVNYVGCRGAVAACMGVTRGPLLDRARVQLSIAETVRAKRNLSVRVTCPQGLPRKPGLRFTCLARGRGVSGSFDVTVLPSGGVSYVGH